VLETIAIKWTYQLFQKCQTLKDLGTILLLFALRMVLDSIITSPTLYIYSILSSCIG
jgi:hypothetical protein